MMKMLQTKTLPKVRNGKYKEKKVPSDNLLN